VLYRVTQTVHVANPLGGPAVTLVAGEQVDTRDALTEALVKVYPWAYEADNTKVERATANPGEKRTTK
jgi:hypothetical protein